MTYAVSRSSGGMFHRFLLPGTKLLEGSKQFSPFSSIRSTNESHHICYISPQRYGSSELSNQHSYTYQLSSPPDKRQETYTIRSTTMRFLYQCLWLLLTVAIALIVNGINQIDLENLQRKSEAELQACRQRTTAGTQTLIQDIGEVLDLWRELEGVYLKGDTPWNDEPRIKKRMLKKMLEQKHMVIYRDLLHIIDVSCGPEEERLTQRCKTARLTAETLKDRPQSTGDTASSTKEASDKNKMNKKELRVEI